MKDTTNHTVTTNLLGGNVQVGTSVQAGSIQGLHFHGAAPLGPPTPHQLLPVPVTFTDRTEDLKALGDWLANQQDFAIRLIAISGLPGIGKTALASLLLHRLRDQFPGGQLYADLHGHAPGGPARTGEVLGQLLRAFRNGPLPVGVDELGAWWRSVTDELRERPVALLLDNAVTADQVRALLPGGAGHLVVVTSREPLAELLHDGAVFHRLGPLDPTAATELLGRCIGPDRIARELAAAQQLAALSAGIPLALNVTATRLATHPGRRIADFITLPGSRQAHIASHGPDQGAQVTSALEGAYWALPRNTARVYRQIGWLFTADFDADLTAAACTLSSAEAAQTLEALACARLLEPLGERPGRGSVYRFHDSVRLHARDRAQREETNGAADETTRRVLDWYLTVATAAERRLTPSHRLLARDYVYPPTLPVPFDDNAGALTWLDAHHLNLMAAVRTAFQYGLYSSTWQLVHAMWPWWHRFHQYDLWAEAHQLGLDAARHCIDAEAEREMLNTLGLGHRGAGRHADAIECFTQVLLLARSVGDQRSESQALHELGSAHHAAGRGQEALPFLLGARQIREAIGYPRGVALSDICLGLVAYEAGRAEEAAERFSKARTTLLEVNDPFDAARALAWLGRAHARLGDLTSAEDLGVQAHAEFVSAGSPRWIARSLELLGETAEDQGRPDDAAQLYARALTVYEPISMPDTERVRGRLHAIAPAGEAHHGEGPEATPSA
ncbi:tetratricopeptide repeat protein [Streptomyces sp. 7N604]|uniref:tetratricopeptide repeat protein n=1 Tax=Streptomyces sp. 7N604 TaxID=3457415 RepID=UPI003FD30806